MLVYEKNFPLKWIIFKGKLTVIIFNPKKISKFGGQSKKTQ